MKFIFSALIALFSCVSTPFAVDKNNVAQESQQHRYSCALLSQQMLNDQDLLHQLTNMYLLKNDQGQENDQWLFWGTGHNQCETQEDAKSRFQYWAKYNQEEGWKNMKRWVISAESENKKIAVIGLILFKDSQENQPNYKNRLSPSGVPNMSFFIPRKDEKSTFAHPKAAEALLAALPLIGQQLQEKFGLDPKKIQIYSELAPGDLVMSELYETKLQWEYVGSNEMDGFQNRSIYRGFLPK